MSWSKFIWLNYVLININIIIIFNSHPIISDLNHFTIHINMHTIIHILFVFLPQDNIIIEDVVNDTGTISN